MGAKDACLRLSPLFFLGGWGLDGAAFMWLTAGFGGARCLMVRFLLRVWYRDVQANPSTAFGGSPPLSRGGWGAGGAGW